MDGPLPSPNELRTAARSPCFEVTLKADTPFRLSAQDAYTLRVHHCALDDPASTSSPVSLLCTSGERTRHHLVSLTATQPAAPLRVEFPDSVALMAVGGAVCVFLSWNLKKGRVPPEFEPDEEDEHKSDLPVLGEKECLWTKDPVFGGPASGWGKGKAARRKRKRLSKQEEKAKEEAVAEDEGDVAPALVPSPLPPGLTPPREEETASQQGVDREEDGAPPAKRAKTATQIDRRTIPGNTSLNEDVTPPRMMAVVHSSSPERSASSGLSDEGSWGYGVRVPDLPHKSDTPPSHPLPFRPPPLDALHAGSKPVASGDVNVKVSATAPPAAVVPATEKPAAAVPAATVPAAAVPAALGEVVVEVCPAVSPRVVPRSKTAVPKGVLKRRSRLLGSPRHGPKPSPRTTPLQSPRVVPQGPLAVTKKGVQWNPKSPDIRFITPPLSYAHKAFPGGLFDLGVPTLPQSRVNANVSVSNTNGAGARQPLSGLARGGEDEEPEGDVPPWKLRYGDLRPHAPQRVTPKAWRPAVIE
eukprot:TRINITY_DN6188_c0_g1_i1.p1 TRINITY_DN6188_c0_g1~~TRINITY_DN6188_c0_g1_i1.p1  ORF type:complete len:527 (+),score=156.83 TRINITY_DN6188_c0_g1_i1:84-1664(+)